MEKKFCHNKSSELCLYALKRFPLLNKVQNIISSIFPLDTGWISQDGS